MMQCHSIIGVKGILKITHPTPSPAYNSCKYQNFNAYFTTFECLNKAAKSSILEYE
jgi:uncharacterized protein (UPF0254 family)